MSKKYYAAYEQLNKFIFTKKIDFLINFNINT